MENKIKLADRVDEEKVDVVFQQDEMRLCTVKPEWTEEELLGQEGIFYLKDVTNKLKISSADLKKKANEVNRAGNNAWETMGIRKTWTHWILRMTVFRDFFKKQEPHRIRRVEAHWDANEMFSQKGRFFLTEVCEKIPFTPHQIRYQVRGNQNARREFGVWKDPNHKSYLVEMERFSTWIKTTWKTGKSMFNKPSRKRANR